MLLNSKVIWLKADFKSMCGLKLLVFLGVERLRHKPVFTLVNNTAKIKCVSGTLLVPRNMTSVYHQNLLGDLVNRQ